MTLPDWLLERARLGELTPEQQARVDHALRDDPTLRLRLEALDADDRRFRAAHPADRVLPELERRLHVARTREAVARRRRAVGGLAILLPLAATITFAIVSAEDLVRSPESAEQERAKGLAPTLVLHRQVGGASEILRPGDPAAPGDVLQIGYVAVGAPYGVIVSIDGRGAVTTHHSWSTEPPPGEQHAPLAYRLDDAPSFERFFLVTSDDPLDPDDVVAAARSLAAGGDARTGRLELPEGADQRDLLVHKERR